LTPPAQAIAADVNLIVVSFFKYLKQKVGQQAHFLIQSLYDPADKACAGPCGIMSMHSA
jgi:hypothetical protein